MPGERRADKLALEYCASYRALQGFTECLIVRFRVENGRGYQRQSQLN